MRLIVVPVGPSHAAKGVDPVRQAVECALDLRPEVLCLTGESIPLDERRSPALAEALVRSWRQSCLPLFVRGENNGPAPRGALDVMILPGNVQMFVVEDETAEPPTRPFPVGLPEAVLGEAARRLGPSRAGAAYLALAAAALPAAGGVPHLERASLLALSGPVLSPADRAKPLCRVIDLEDAFSSSHGASHEG
jgi:hypothetical protein